MNEKCNHIRLYAHFSLALSPDTGLPIGFYITHFCDYCGGRGESFLVRADGEEILQQYGRSLDNAKHIFRERVESRLKNLKLDPRDQAENDLVRSRSFFLSLSVKVSKASKSQ